MKTKVFRKLVALGIGATMVGATVFGAGAVKLSDYPAPFISNGAPASNLAVVVGDNAAPSDVVGMGDIIQGLQAAAVVKTGAGGVAGPRVRLLGDTVEIGTPTDLLELNETIGDVRETLTEFDLNILKGGSISTRRGVTKYNQYLNFNRSSAYTSNLVKFAEDEFDNVGHFFFVADGAWLFDWVLQFEEGFKSDIEAQAGTQTGDRVLRDLEDRNIYILGTEYAVVGTKINNNTKEFRIEFLGGPVFDALGEGDKKTYTLNGKEYEIEVVIISETLSSGQGEVLLKVNGETLPRLRATETEPTADGTLIGIRDIIPTGKDTQSSVVRFYLGATKLEFKDRNYSDDAFQPAGAVINNEVIEDSNVKVRLTTNLPFTETTVESITYRLNADALVGDLFVPPGHGVREYLDEPEGMIAPIWDIRYEGLLDTGVTTIKWNPIGRDEYKLEFTNQEGLNYVFPFITGRDSSISGLRYGDFTSGRHRNLIWAENRDPSAGGASIEISDFFIVSDIEGSGVVGTGGVSNANVNVSSTSTNASFSGGKAFPSFTPDQTDNTAFTRVLKFESIDTTNRVLTFTDLATGTKQVTYDTSNTANLIVGGVTYQVLVNTSNQKLSVDLNADGVRANGTAVVATEGGALLLLGTFPINNTIVPANTTGAPNGTGANQSILFSGQAVGTTINISVNTLAKQFDEAQSILSIGVPFEFRSTNRIGIRRTGIQGLDLIFLTSEPEIAQELDRYGTFYELFDPLTTDTPEELTIEYPLSQRGVQVFVTAGQVQAEVVAGGTASQLQPLPVGTSKLASEVSDVTMYNAIVVGGPCANPVAAKLMNNPEPCWQAVPENKAILKLYEHANGNVALLVAGRTALNTRQAARALLTGEVSDVDAKEASVTGTTVTDISVSAV